MTMNEGTSHASAVLGAAFTHVLILQFVLVVASFILTGLSRRRGSLRTTLPPRAAASAPLENATRARRTLRWSFGLLWIFDGLLQTQSSMPGLMAPRVLSPAAHQAPAWLRPLVEQAATMWTRHPIAFALSAVWIQIGLGLWMILAASENFARLSGVASATWALAVWVVGEGLGGAFSTPWTWWNGAPGAVLFYGVAGLLVALSEEHWRALARRRVLSTAIGAYFALFALVQIWSSRSSDATHSLAAYARMMSVTPQPRLSRVLVTDFADVARAHGVTVNALLVTALAVAGVGLASARASRRRIGAISALVVTVATWVLVQDWGFWGGVGTDPNTMVPLAVLVVVAYRATQPDLAGADSSPRVRAVLGRAQRDALAACALAVVALGAGPALIASAAPRTLARDAVTTPPRHAVVSKQQPHAGGLGPVVHSRR